MSFIINFIINFLTSFGLLTAPTSPAPTPPVPVVDAPVEVNVPALEENVLVQVDEVIIPEIVEENVPVQIENESPAFIECSNGVLLLDVEGNECPVEYVLGDPSRPAPPVSCE